MRTRRQDFRQCHKRCTGFTQSLHMGAQICVNHVPPYGFIYVILISSITIAQCNVAAGWGQEVNCPSGQEKPLWSAPPFPLRPAQFSFHGTYPYCATRLFNTQYFCYNKFTRYFEVENVLLHTLRVKRNAGQGTPAKIPKRDFEVVDSVPTTRRW